MAPKSGSMMEKSVKNYIICQAVIPYIIHELIFMIKTIGLPFENDAMDFVEPFYNGKYILLIMDEFSRLFLVDVVPSTSFH